MKIITNNVPRDVIDAWELNAKERTEFDYKDWEAIDDGRDSASFIRYKNQLYDLSEFVCITKRSGLAGRIGWDHPIDDDSPLTAWHGMASKRIVTLAAS